MIDSFSLLFEVLSIKQLEKSTHCSIIIAAAAAATSPMKL